jgi:putative tricarboxylic transport membrane protein
MALIRHPKDFCSGLVFIAVGAGAVVLGRDYSLGTATKMGPGYFPTMLGMVLTLIGIAVAARSFLMDGEGLGRMAWKPLALVIGATVLFGVLLRGAGMAPALVVLVVGSGAASRMFRWTSALALAVGLAAFSVLIFVKALGLPLPVLGTWFGG